MPLRPDDVTSPTTLDTADVLHLRAAGVSLVLDLAAGLPRVLHWGADLGDLPGAALDALRLAARSAPAASTTTPSRMSSTRSYSRTSATSNEIGSSST